MARAVLSTRYTNWLRPPHEGTIAERAVVLTLAAVPVLVVLGLTRGLPIVLGLVAGAAMVALYQTPDAIGRLRAAVIQPEFVVAIAAVIYAQSVTQRGNEGLAWLAAYPGLPFVITMQIGIAGYLLCCRRDLQRLSFERVLWLGTVAAIALLWVAMAYTMLLRIAVPSGWHEVLARHSASTNRSLIVLALFALLLPAAKIPARWRIATWTSVTALMLAAWVLPAYRPLEGRITHTPSDTTQLGFIVALAAYALVHRFGRRMSDLLLGGVVGFIVLAPWIHKALWAVAPSLITIRRGLILDRIEIWNAAASRYLGGDLLQLLFGRGRDFLRSDGDLVIARDFTQHLPAHPHSAVLQVWLEGGVLGAAFLVFFAIVGWLFVRRAAAWQQPAFTACLVMMLVTATVTHAIWNAWFISALLLVFNAMMILAEPAAQPHGHEPDHSQPPE